jgi:hypothetical protein
MRRIWSPEKRGQHSACSGPMTPSPRLSKGKEGSGGHAAGLLALHLAVPAAPAGLLCAGLGACWPGNGAPGRGARARRALMLTNARD